MANPNVQFDTSNLAIYLDTSGGSSVFKCYSLYHASAPLFPNSLVVKDATGTLILPTYPTQVSLTTPVISLDFDGYYFYSLQALMNGQIQVGSVLTRWTIDKTTNILHREDQKSFPGNYFFTALAVESYRFKLSQPAARNTRTLRLRITEDKLGASRLRIGDLFILMPNDAGNYLISSIDSLNVNPSYIDITLADDLNADYGTGNLCIGDRSVYLFDNYGDTSAALPRGRLFELRSQTLNTTAVYPHGMYSNVSAAAFGLINQVPYINQTAKTACLCFYRGLGIRIQDVSLVPSGLVTANFSLENYDTNLTTPLPIYDMCVRSDTPDDPSNTAAFYRVQKAWRDDRFTSGTFSNYNFIISNVSVQNMYMNLAFEPQYISISGMAKINCYLTNNYGFSTDPASLPYPPQVKWSVVLGDGTFLDGAYTTVNASGIASNRYRGGTRINLTEQVQACVVTAAGGTC